MPIDRDHEDPIAYKLQPQIDNITADLIETSPAQETTISFLQEQVKLIKVPHGPHHDKLVKTLTDYASVFDPALPPEGCAFKPMKIKLTKNKIVHNKVRSLKPTTPW